MDMQPILDSLPADWEVLVWDNGARTLSRPNIPGWAPVPYLCSPDADCISQEALDSPTGCVPIAWTVPDLSVYARYEAVTYAAGELIFTQDDDVIVSDPQAIVSAWEMAALERNGWRSDSMDKQHVVCNMPQEFRHEFYNDHALVGFGACFHRAAPQRAFQRYARFYANRARIDPDVPVGLDLTSSRILRTCDMVFTGLTPRVLVDVPKTNLPYAEDAGRMYRKPGYINERQDMLDLVRKVSDGR